MFMIFFRAMPCHYFSVPRFSVPCRAKIFRAMIFRAGPCHKSAGPPFRAVPGRPWKLGSHSCMAHFGMVKDTVGYGLQHHEQPWHTCSKRMVKDTTGGTADG